MYSIIFVSVILGIVGWSFSRPVDSTCDDPGQGSLVMDELIWSEEGSCATMKVAEVNSGTNEVLRSHEVLIEHGNLFRLNTEEGPLDNDISIKPSAVFSPDRSSYILVYYERPMTSGQDPGLHISITDGITDLDLTDSLRESLMRGEV